MIKENEGLGFYYFKNKWKWFGQILLYYSVSCALREGFKLWLLGGWWNTSKNKNGGQEVT